MTDIGQLKEKYPIDLDSFRIAKEDYWKFCFSLDNPHYSAEKSKEVFENFQKRFDHILRLCANESKVKESAKICFSEQKEVIPHVAFVGDVTKIEVTIGHFRRFYMAARLENPQNIKFMKDEFFALLFRLSTVGKFRFTETHTPTKSMRKKAPHLFNKTGNYYKLLRNYFLLDYKYSFFNQLGTIEVSWDADTSFESLIPSCCEAFQIIYQLNFLLWRHDNKTVKLSQFTQL